MLNTDLVILKISSEDLNKFQPFSGGIESKLYYKDNLLIKKYYEISDNIKNKLKILSSLSINGVALPRFLLKIDNKTCGYAMNFMKGYYPIYNSMDLPIYNKLLIIKKIKQILDKLHENNIIYGDLNINNVITNEEDVCLCDIGNCKINEYSFDMITKTMKNYMDNVDVIDFNLDNYMLNLLTIYYLNNLNYDDVLEEMQYTLISKFNNRQTKELIGLTDNEKCLDIGYNMLNPQNGVDCLIDYIDIEKYKSRTL